MTTITFNPKVGKPSFDYPTPCDAVNIGFTRMSGTDAYRLTYEQIETKSSVTLITADYRRVISTEIYLRLDGTVEAQCRTEGEWTIEKPSIDVQVQRSPMMIPDSIGSKFLRK